jgi:hypothetical protein
MAIKRQITGKIAASEMIDRPGHEKPPFSPALAEQVNGDVARFLIAFTGMTVTFTTENAETLRQATDKLLHCAVHVRLMLEQLAAGPTQLEFQKGPLH